MKYIILIFSLCLSGIVFGQYLDTIQINEDLGHVNFAGEEAFKINDNKLYITYYQYTVHVNSVKVIFAYSEDYGHHFQYTEIDEMELSYGSEFLRRPVLELLSDGTVIIAYIKLENNLNNLYKAVSDMNAENFEIELIAENITDEVHLKQQDDILTITYQYCDSMKINQFSYFQYFTEAAMEIFRGQDVFEGPVHSNEDIWIAQDGGGNNDGWPTFYDHITTAGIFRKYPIGTRLEDSGAPMDQIFQGEEPGWLENVDPIELPETVGYYQTDFITPFSGFDADIVYVNLYSLGYESYIGRYQLVRIDSFKVYSWFPQDHDVAQEIIDNGGNWFENAEHIWTNYVPIYEMIWSPGPSGVVSNQSVWVESELWIEGAVSGIQTWGCADTVYIVGDITYEGTTPGAQPDDPDNLNLTDFFGLVSEKRILVKYKHRDPETEQIMSPNCNDIYLYGAYAALGRGDTLVYGNQACHYDGIFSFEYQHPHGSTPDFVSISPYTGNDTVYTFIDLHKYIYSDTMNVPENLQGFVLHGNNPPTALPCGYPYEDSDYLDSYPNNSDEEPNYIYQYPYGTDLPWYNPIWPESAEDIVFERGHIRLFGSMIQRRRGYIHKSGTDPFNHNGNEWDLENFQFDGTHPSTGYAKDYQYDSRLKYQDLINFPSLDPSYSDRRMKILTSLDGGQVFFENFEYSEEIPYKPNRSFVTKNSDKIIVVLQTESHLLKLYISDNNGISYTDYYELYIDDFNSFYFDQLYLTEDYRLYLFGELAPWNYNHIYTFDLNTGLLTNVDYGYLQTNTSDFTLSNSEARVYAVVNGFAYGYIDDVEILYSINSDVLDNTISWIPDTGDESLYGENVEISLAFNENDSLYIFLNALSTPYFARNLYLMKTSIEGITPETEDEIPDEEISMNIYPNPFNPSTLISLHIPGDSSQEELEVCIYNMKGQKVITLDCQPELVKGRYSVTWDGSDGNGHPVGSGIYFAMLKVDGKSELVKKCLLLK
jgi:hypothetical protein